MGGLAKSGGHVRAAGSCPVGGEALHSNQATQGGLVRTPQPHPLRRPASRPGLLRINLIPTAGRLGTDDWRRAAGSGLRAAAAAGRVGGSAALTPHQHAHHHTTCVPCRPPPLLRPPMHRPPVTCGAVGTGLAAAKPGRHSPQGPPHTRRVRSIATGGESWPALRGRAEARRPRSRLCPPPGWPVGRHVDMSSAPAAAADPGGGDGRPTEQTRHATRPEARSCMWRHAWWPCIVSPRLASGTPPCESSSKHDGGRCWTPAIARQPAGACPAAMGRGRARATDGQRRRAGACINGSCSCCAVPVPPCTLPLRCPPFVSSCRPSFGLVRLTVR